MTSSFASPARLILVLLALAALSAATLVAWRDIGVPGAAALPVLRPVLAGAEPDPPGPAKPLAVAPFVLDLKSKDAQTAAACLADAVYYEAGFQPVDGQRAVAQVVLNRVRDRNFPNTICGVVYEGWKRKTGCQFSFACDSSLLRRLPNAREWAAALSVARQALSGYVMAAVGSATHYHTLDVRPWWRSTVVQVAQVGSQIFYRWPGRAGLPGALDDDRRLGPETRITPLDYRLAHEAPRPRHRIEGVLRLASRDTARG
jgi:hypothetical protein